ncbi:MAG: secondary thiamine-phosphate synthase enzyme YjbQ [Rhodanobacter sp.]
MTAVSVSMDVATPGRGFIDITDLVTPRVAGSGVSTGIVHVFVPHTSCSLVLGENADPAVGDDLERWFARAVPDADPLFRHVAEGPDDMPAHVRSILAGVSVTIPVRAGRVQLGTWQGLYLWEHRHQAHRRTVIVTVVGTPQDAP